MTHSLDRLSYPNPNTPPRHSICRFRVEDTVYILQPHLSDDMWWSCRKKPRLTQSSTGPYVRILCLSEAGSIFLCHLHPILLVTAGWIAFEVENVVHVTHPFVVFDVLGERVRDHVVLGDVHGEDLTVLDCLGDDLGAPREPHRLLRRGVRRRDKDNGDQVEVQVVGRPIRIPVSCSMRS